MEIPIEIKASFVIGETVYLITDRDQLEYLVTAIIVEYKCIKYRISQGAGPEIECFEFEISHRKRVI